MTDREKIIKSNGEIITSEKDGANHFAGRQISTRNGFLYSGMHCLDSVVIQIISVFDKKKSETITTFSCIVSDVCYQKQIKGESFNWDNECKIFLHEVFKIVNK